MPRYSSRREFFPVRPARKQSPLCCETILADEPAGLERTPARDNERRFPLATKSRLRLRTSTRDLRDRGRKPGLYRRFVGRVHQPSRHIAAIGDVQLLQIIVALLQFVELP